MNQDIRENLSAGIDGELSREELRFLLRRIEHDASLQQTWARYHLARDGLRRQLSPMAASGFADRVMSAIGQQVVPIETRRNHWLRWSAGGAIAASVAAAALMVGQPNVGDAERGAMPSSRQSVAAVNLAPSIRPSVPATVPPWLSGNSAGLLSQQASATLGAPMGESRPAYGRLSGFPSMRGYRTLDNKDGSYLLLLDPVRQRPDGARQRQAAAIAQ
jgi:sigma-E factor negative regulatory protein RseA